ncbi:MAG TPA: VTT domain-containing protein, partial [Polyangiales bacterium]|nr:VTT domain-containing protein [Polyangiales bacterium]
MNETDRAPRARTLVRGAALLLAMLALPLFWAWVGRSVTETLRTAVAEAGAWGELLYVFGSAILIALCAPASLIYMTAGMVFGMKWGMAWAALGAVLGSTTAFVVARTALGGKVSRLLARSARLERFGEAIKERGLWLTLLLRLSLLVPIGPVSYALGSMRTRSREFLLTSPAVLPAVFAYVYAGELAGSWGSSHTRERAGWEWVVLGVGLLATIGAAWLLARAAGSARRAPARKSGASPAPRTPTLPGLPDSSLEPPLPVDARAHPRMVGVEIEFLRL